MLLANQTAGLIRKTAIISRCQLGPIFPRLVLTYNSWIFKINGWIYIKTIWLPKLIVKEAHFTVMRENVALGKLNQLWGVCNPNYVSYRRENWGPERWSDINTVMWYPRLTKQLPLDPTLKWKAFWLNSQYTILHIPNQGEQPLGSRIISREGVKLGMRILLSALDLSRVCRNRENYRGT